MARRRGRLEAARTLLLSTVFVAGVAGCGTLATLQDDFGVPSGGRIPRVYSGTVFDVGAFSRGLYAGFVEGSEAGIMTLIVFDLPFSIVADTVVLPYTLYLSFTKGFWVGGGGGSRSEEREPSSGEDRVIDLEDVEGHTTDPPGGERGRLRSG
jgi:uncharacterized protein YceK